MSTKLILLLSIFFLSFTPIVMENKNSVVQDPKPTDCSQCYFMGQGYSIGRYSPSGVQRCVLGTNKKGAIWVMNNANIFAETCMYCQLAGKWYSEGAANGTTSPSTYCRSGQWIQ